MIQSRLGEMDTDSRNFASIKQKPCKDQWGDGLAAMTDALYLEKEVYEALLDLHSVAENNTDPQVWS